MFLKAQTNADPLTNDLKKKRASNERFWHIAQPDVAQECLADVEGEGSFRVSFRGFHSTNSKPGNVESSGADRIALWIIDRNDGRGLFLHRGFFLTVRAKDGWATLARSLKAETNVTWIAAYRGTASLPLEPREHGRSAQDRGRPGCRESQVCKFGLM